MFDRKHRNAALRGRSVCLTVALSALLVCGGAGAYQEAPMLAEQVARGELPPVDERLPAEPMVVQPLHEIGRYGGTWRRTAMGFSDIQLSSRLGYEPPVRWDVDGRGVVPGLATSWEILDGGRTYVLHLRKGVRWSDGQPLTSEDFQFFFDDVLLHKELTPVYPAWLALDGVPPTLTTPDAYTLVFTFPQPFSLFLEMLTFRGNLMVLPKHYMRQFHPKYVDKDALDALAKDNGFGLWFQLFQDRASLDRNPDLPTFRPFRIKTPLPAARIVAERNPYYWKVDPEGNQLPYIDRIAYTDVQNAEITTFKAMSGEIDFQARGVDPANYPLFMQNRHKGRYRVLRDATPGPTVLFVNQYSRDEDLRPLLQDRRFRIALSVAVNRAEVVDLVYNGMAVPSRGVVSPYDPHYLPEFDEKYIEYDPVLANKLLDELGMKRGFGGKRTLPNGKRFRQLLHVYPAETGTGEDLWQLVCDYFREVGLDFTVKVDARALSVMQVANGNSDFWGYSTAGMHWTLDPLWYVPWNSRTYFAPRYGRYVGTKGHDKQGVKPPAEIQQMLDWYLELRSCMDLDRRFELGQRVMRQWVDECYTIGVCRTERLTIVSDRFKNVPDHIIHSWRLMSPGYIGIEQFYIDGGDAE